MLLTACSSEEVTNGVTDTSQAKPLAVGFDIYASSATRAGDAGIQTTATIQAAGKGFGVFAQYSSGTDYSKAADPVANFMWNQMVTFHEDIDFYEYTPLKYWPNEENDKVSFIAYYPYTDTNIVEADPSNPVNPMSKESTGVIPLLTNSGTGLPSFTFTVKEDADKQTDLLVSDLITDLPYHRDNESASGAPFDNLSIYDRVKFLFRHALSKVEFRIVADRDIYKDVARFKLNSLNITNIYKDGTLTTDYAAATGTTLTWSGQSTKHGTDETDPQYKIDFKTITPQLLMPQTLGDDAMINLDYEITFKSDGTSYHYSGTTPVPDQEYTYRNAASLQLNTMKEIGTGDPLLEWKANHHYIYTIRLRANRIEFTGQVVEWGETTTINNIEVIE